MRPGAGAAVQTTRRCPNALQRGSAVILVLFTCLSVAVAIQALSAVVVCVQRALSEEAQGRQGLRDRDVGLAIARLRALAVWEPVAWTSMTGGPDSVEEAVTSLEGGAGWVMGVQARQLPPLSPLVTSAWVERGRDGIDLPLAALVATRVIVDTERDRPWLDTEPVPESPSLGVAAPEAIAVAYLQETPAEGAPTDECALVRRAGEWQLDEGWRALVCEAAGRNQTAGLEPPGSAGEAAGNEQAPRAVALGSDSVALCAPSGQTALLPVDGGGESVEAPMLAVMCGGGDLDARHRGDIYGVIVVDEGSLFLEGTVVHGAVFVSGSLVLGSEGCVRFCAPVLRWATDRSLRRARLVPGTRHEGVE